MPDKPVMLLAHPRACSTVFERIFLGHEKITCIHEPFDDAFFFGPERLHPRHDHDERARLDSGGSNETFQGTVKFIQEAQSKVCYIAKRTLTHIYEVDGLADSHCGVRQDKRLFIKGMARVLMPFDGQPASIAPSFFPSGDMDSSSPAPDHNSEDVIGTVLNGYKATLYPSMTRVSPNPTVLPDAVLKIFHFTFLIRHPRLSIPSIYRLSTPPRSESTGWHGFNPKDAGYKELRRLFDYLRQIDVIGPKVATRKTEDAERCTSQGGTSQIEICVIEANSLLENPEAVVEAYCASTGLPFETSMLSWDQAEDRKEAEHQFGKWKRPFHDVAVDSTSLHPSTQKNSANTSLDDDYIKWTEEFQKEGADMIYKTVKANLEDYLYLKQFALEV